MDPDYEPGGSDPDLDLMWRAEAFADQEGWWDEAVKAAQRFRHAFQGVLEEVTYAFKLMEHYDRRTS